MRLKARPLVRRIVAAFGAIGVCAAFVRPSSGVARPLTVIVAGDTLGYLSPCGCSEPMTGGILRQGSLIRHLQAAGPTILLYTGGMVPSQSRQNVLKAETLAVALESWQVAASNLTASDAKLGSGELLSLFRLAGKRMVSSSLQPSPSNELPTWLENQGLLIGGATVSAKRLADGLEEQPMALDAAVHLLLAQAGQRNEAPVLLLDGSRSAAIDLAKRYPELKLITYRSNGKPPLHLEKVGSVALATPGERGQYLVALEFANGEASNYKAQVLDPSVPNDPATLDVYRTYLRRVSREGLWQKSPRIAGPEFVGSERCAPCHQEAYAVWKRSAHSRALTTLGREGHDQDPECLPCHIVGGAFRSGFQSLRRTPQLGSVGCESCHGSGAAHVRDPVRFRLPKAGSQSCAQCHVSLNSPNFDFHLYWSRIRHRR